MKPIRILGCGLALLTFSTLASAAAPLECPKGTRLESKNDGTAQFCVDTATGLKEGPERQTRPNGSVEGEGANHAGKKHGVARTYAEDGTLMAEMEYQQGELKTMHMTPAGLRYQVDRINKQYLANKEPYHLSLSDERTLVWDTIVEREAPSTPDEKKKFRDTFRGNRAVCRMFSGMGLGSITFRVLTTKGTELDTFTTTAADCGAAQPAK